MLPEKTKCRAAFCRLDRDFFLRPRTRARIFRFQAFGKPIVFAFSRLAQLQFPLGQNIAGGKRFLPPPAPALA